MEWEGLLQCAKELATWYLLSELQICFRSENCSLLDYYAVCSGNFLPAFRDHLSVPSSAVKTPEDGTEAWNSFRSSCNSMLPLILQSLLSYFGVFRLTCVGYSSPMCATCLVPLILVLAFIWCSTDLQNLFCVGGTEKNLVCMWATCNWMNRTIIYV